MCARAWVAEHARARQYTAILFVRTFRVQHPQTLRRHTIDAPVNVAMIITNRYRESTVIGSNQID